MSARPDGHEVAKKLLGEKQSIGEGEDVHDLPMMATPRLNKALVNFQGMVKSITRSSTAKVSETRSYKYAELGDIVSGIQEPLKECGLAVMQTLHLDARGGHYLTTTLLHESGEERASDIRIPPTEDPKTFGLRVTYARRYGLSAILNIATEEDTDADVHHNVPAAAPRATPGRATGKTAPAKPASAPSGPNQKRFFGYLNAATAAGIYEVTIQGGSDIERAQRHAVIAELLGMKAYPEPMTEDHYTLAANALGKLLKDKGVQIPGVPEPWQQPGSRPAPADEPPDGFVA